MTAAFDIALCTLSWRAPVTLRHTLDSYRSAGIDTLFAQRWCYFNEITDDDRAVARDAGYEVLGTTDNVGIFGGMAALAAAAGCRFLLLTENDCPSVVGPDELSRMLAGVLADMADHDCPVFSLRSRYDPGDKFDRRTRYEAKFVVDWPLGAPAPTRRPAPALWRRWEDRRRAKTRGSAIFALERPDLRHPDVIRRTAGGHWITTSRVLGWSNQSILVDAAFYRSVILQRVRDYPAASTVNGHQDIEAALKRDGWWAKQNVPMGQAEPGAFTHRRLDR